MSDNDGTQTAKSGLFRGNKPWLSYFAGVVVIGCCVAVILIDGPNSAAASRLLSIASIAIPALFAAGYAEKNSRDIHNGVLTEKVKQATAEVIDTKQVLVRNGPVVAAELTALQRLLELNTSATQTNTDVIQSQNVAAAAEAKPAKEGGQTWT